MIRIPPFTHSGSKHQLATAHLATESPERGSEPTGGSTPNTAPDKKGLYIWRILFQTLSGDAEFAASVRNPVLLGRADPTTGSRPDVDFTSVGGQDLGVSRHHAIVIPTDEGPCVIDLDTANGTAINGQRLVSGQRYRLRTGDRLELGKLALIVSDMGIVPRGRTAHSTVSINLKAQEA
jgi:pSer/pThr/pTyr-binding forkhead associated (FHA) protein